MSATTREIDFVSFDNHPVLVRLLMGKVSMRNVHFPNFVSAFRPLDRNLDILKQREDMYSKTYQDQHVYRRNETHLITRRRRNQAVKPPFRRRAMTFIMLHQRQIKLQSHLVNEIPV